MKYFGFFRGMKYGDICTDDFGEYKKTKNKIEKNKILDYIEKLPIAAIAPMTVEDIFDGEKIEQAGIYEDGNFTFPLDFLHYYRKFDIGIPVDYEEYISSKLEEYKRI